MARHSARQPRRPVQRRETETPCASLHSGKRAVEPAIFRGLHAGRAGFHIVLRVEVRARVIGRTRCMDNRQMLLLPQRLERR